MEDPEARQPYHVVTEQDAKRGMRLVRRTARVAQSRALATLRELPRAAGPVRRVVHAVGLVVGSDTDPNAISHPHIRAHALEGRLYRDAVEASAAACGLPRAVLVERDAFRTAASVLGRGPSRLKAATLALGAPMGRPWAADEKLATLAAWVALARS